MKKVAALVAMAALLFSGLNPASAAPYVQPTSPVPVGNARYSLMEQENRFSSSYILITKPRPGQNMPDEYYCDGYGTGPCNFDDPAFVFTGETTIIAPKCTSADQYNCIESLSIFSAGQVNKPAEFVRNIKGLTVPADPEHGLTEGSTVSLWKSTDDAIAASLPNYVAQVGFKIRYDRSKKKFALTSIQASVQPYREVSGPFSGDKVSVRTLENGRSAFSFPGPTTGCAWTEDGVCGTIKDFMPGTRVSMTLRVAKTIGGWFSGRMAETDISIKAHSQKSNQITITANPVDVPRFSAVISQKTGSQAALRYIRDTPTSIDPFNIFGSGQGSDQGTFTNRANAFEWVEKFRTDANDTAAGVSTVWSFQNSTQGIGSRCLSDSSKVLGLVTTNSMVFQGRAPDYKNGSLAYTVAGLHYSPDGTTPVSGSYDLVMLKSVAQCLYGFGQVPVTAQVTVLNERGVKTTAVTILGEKDGWLKLSAKGFTFSKKTINIKLGAKKKTTITCVSKSKKNSIKKITGYTPKCPTGFKKK